MKKTLLIMLSLFAFADVMQAQLARAYQDGKCGFVNSTTGQWIIIAKYQAASDFKNGFAVFMINEKKGYINDAGEEIIAAQFDDAGHFEDGIAKVSLNGKFGFINLSGATVINFKFEFADEFHENLSKVILNGKTGFIDRKGNVVIPCIYDDAHYFKNGLAPVKLGMWGYLTKKGEWHISPSYQAAYLFNEHEAKVKHENKWKIINRKGEVEKIIVTEEDEMETLEEKEKELKAFKNSNTK